MSPSCGLSSLPEYQTLLSQTFSPDGSLLAVGDDRGRVGVYRVDDLAARGNHNAQVEVKVMIKDPQAKRKPILALAATEHDLIIGTVGEIQGYKWRDINRGKTEVSWKAAVPSFPGTATETEVNWVEVDRSVGPASTIIFGGGDNLIHFMDLETRTLKKSLSGHSDYIHSLSHCSISGLVASASEDGSVRIWDQRQKNSCVQTFQPGDKPNLSRPKIGSWIGDVSLTEDWLVCGGGPRAALWYLKTMSPNEPLPPAEDKGLHVTKIEEERIILGGETNKIYQTDLSGNLLSEVEVSCPCVYSVVCQEKPVQILCCVGASARMDICSPSFSYKDRTVLFGKI